MDRCLLINLLKHFIDLSRPDTVNAAITFELVAYFVRIMKVVSTKFSTIIFCYHETFEEKWNMRHYFERHVITRNRNNEEKNLGDYNVSEFFVSWSDGYHQAEIST